MTFTSSEHMTITSSEQMIITLSEQIIITLQRRGPIAAEFAGPGPAAITLPSLFGSGFMFMSTMMMMMVMNVVIMVMTVKVMTMRRHCNDEGSDNVGCRPQSARVDKDQGAMLLLWGEDQGFEFHSFPGAELLQYIRADFKGGPR